tara:strand:+ start:408 stop:572 length:165 start_codon:yes stop_codon:yes gene_type:complete
MLKKNKKPINPPIVVEKKTSQKDKFNTKPDEGANINFTAANKATVIYLSNNSKF